MIKAQIKPRGKKVKREVKREVETKDFDDDEYRPGKFTDLT